MCTIVIHGTMALAAAKHSRWWWDSWSVGGFLRAVRMGMEDAGGASDLWRLAGRAVSEIPTLQPEWSLLWGRMGQFPQHQGHFTWDGADMGISRLAGADQLVLYLNALRVLAPAEPLRIIAHSHGCNVVKLASTRRRLRPDVVIDRAVFLACPHLHTQGVQGTEHTYPLNPGRFGAILNLYSATDSVQTSIAEGLPGLPSYRLVEWQGFSAARVDTDPAARARYQNLEIVMADSGVPAHTAMHGAVVGYLAGRWLAKGGNIREILKQLDEPLPQVPRGDFGEGVQAPASP
jgi:hypothetical protein